MKSQQLLSMLKSGAVNPQGFSSVVFAACWNLSAYSGDLNVVLTAGESLRDHIRSTKAGWNPDWLLDPDVGFRVADAGGTELNSADAPARQAGRVRWKPTPVLPKVDDQTADSAAPTTPERQRRLAGEVLLLALWRREARKHEFFDAWQPSPTSNISGQTRGARFKNALSTYLGSHLPEWTFPSEVPLRQIYGLHLRKDVGIRKSDILVVDSRTEIPRVMAVISSKWSWRSDRGTEAAQMVPLNKYRPDIPYVIFTAEFVRATEVGRESVEDRSYHLCPSWVGAWHTLYDSQITQVSSLSLQAVAERGELLARSLGLGTIEQLTEELSTAGKYQ